ncbi:MAG TPA: protein-L-isoaspartate O-methyltransferase [Woeseiaceae bacterium]|nr:protein-L-isoaspartate O-methyltransferase [Woeseiaceae bacterium]
MEFARQQMIEQQVRAWDVFDPVVLDVLAAIPREQFVPRDFRALAFADSEIPIGYGQSMMTPTVEGRVLQALSLTGTENVLEIGTGTGFLTACIARLAHFVSSIEIHEKLHKRAKENLADAGIENLALMVQDAMERLPDGSFDVIVVGGSLPRFDTRFVNKLVQGGRMFVVVGNAPSMDALLVRRTSGSDWQSSSLFETSLEPLVNAAPPPKFSF